MEGSVFTLLAMQSPILSSTFFLTLLMMIGLVFFIRASTKERIEVTQFAIAQPQDACIDQLQSYFLQRSYQSIDAEMTENKRVFEGLVRPSVFLALLLLLLAGIGFLCLALVLSILIPQGVPFVWGLVLLAPAASIFYWKKSRRIEQVSFKVEPLSPHQTVPSQTSPNPADSASSVKSTESLVQTKVTVMGHRDELASLQQALNLEALDEKG